MRDGPAEMLMLRTARRLAAAFKLNCNAVVHNGRLNFRCQNPERGTQFYFVRNLLVCASLLTMSHSQPESLEGVRDDQE